METSCSAYEALGLNEIKAINSELFYIRTTIAAKILEVVDNK